MGHTMKSPQRPSVDWTTTKRAISPTKFESRSSFSTMELLKDFGSAMTPHVQKTVDNPVRRAVSPRADAWREKFELRP